MRTLAVCALVLLGSAGWIASRHVSAAQAQDPEPTTISTPTVAPEPDPAPIPAPKPPPKPKPKPVAPRSQPRPVAPQPASPAPAPATTEPVTLSSAPKRAKPRPRPRLKPKKRARPKVERKHVIVKKAKPKRSIAPVELVGATAIATSDESVDSLVLVVMSLAIFCFAIAAIPWALVPSRAAYYVAPRQTDLTLLGFVLLVAAGFTFVLTRGP